MSCHISIRGCPSLVCIAALRRKPPVRRHKTSGIAALEFIFVMPTIMLLFFGIGTFASALYAKQSLYDISGEVARTCVLKDFGSYDAVTNCVSGVGSYLTSNVQRNVCLGEPVTFASQIFKNGLVVTQVPATYRQEIDVLQVTAGCSWSFAPGFNGSGAIAPTHLSATVSIPLLFNNAPL